MSELTITRQKRQVQYFTESLGDDSRLDMVLISGGSFLMGTPEGEEGSSEDERPQHSVTVPSFFIGQYPITQAQWRIVAAFSQVNRELNPNPSSFKGDDRPVEQVSWYDAVEFCDRLFQQTGKPYRLPSEAEWEYACRAGTTTPFHFGKTITTNLANYDGDYVYGIGEKGTYRRETAPVGSFGVANAFGLYDMHGNVWEWCADYWHDNYQGAPTDGSAWLNEDENAPRLVRGGAWVSGPWICRSASRSGVKPDVKDLLYSFRVACSLARTL